MQRDSEITFGNFKALKVSFSLCYSTVPCTSVGIFSPCVDTPVIIAGTVGLKTKFPDVNTNCSVDPLPSLENCLWLTGGLLRPPVEPTATADSCGGSTPACGSGWESSVLPFTLQPPRGVGWFWNREGRGTTLNRLTRPLQMDMT